MKPIKFPAKEKNEARKAKKGGRRESKSQDCCATFKPKNYLEFSAHARLRKLNQNAATCTTCK